VAVCRYHPDRPGIGVCIRCRGVICAACCTKVDDINHCHACLRSLGSHKTQPIRSALGVPLLSALAVCLGTLVMASLCYLVQGVLAP
jgi:hypothetical protein